MTNRPRILLVGVCGYGGIYFREMTSRDTGADIVGICEISPDVDAKFPLIGEMGIPVYKTLEAFYENNAADLAVIATPVHFHAQMALTCLEHGSNVLCEKPLCLTTDEVAQISACCEATGKFLALGYQLNFRRDVLALKRDILSGRFGAPIRLGIYHCYRRGAKYYARNNWAGRIMVDGREVFDSPFTNANAHYFQMMTFLLGTDMHTCCDVLDVDAELYHGNPDVENYDIAALRFRTDRDAALYYYTAHPLKTDHLGPVGTFEFEKGTVTFDSEAPSFKAVMADGTTHEYTQPTAHGVLQKFYDAIDYVKTGGVPMCDAGADYARIRAMRMVQAQPIRMVREELREHIEVNGDTFLTVKGIEDVFVQCAGAWALPSEIGLSLGDA